MKKTKIFAGFTAFAFAVSLGFLSCSNTEDDNNSSSDELELESAAFSVLRSLTDLSKYDPEAVKEDDDDEYIGIETLPSNWKSMTFACDQGVALDGDDSVRIIAVSGVADAKDFFFSMIGEEVDENDLSGLYTWDCQGLGSLTFKEISGDKDLYATIDVNISRISGVSQIRFVSAEYFACETAESNAENSFSGTPYYSAGDVIQRKSDGTYWICVRPAGGIWHKDKSYWICLSPFDKNGKSIIKSETKKQTTYWNEQQEEFKSNWKYAKNLMSLKTAKAAYHTFNAITNPLAQELCNTKNELDEGLIYDALVKSGFDLLNLHCEYPKDGEKTSKNYTEKYGNFNFAYGSPKTDKKRIVYGNEENADVNYVQPFIHGKCTGYERARTNIKEELFTKWYGTDYTENGPSQICFPYVFSITDTCDDTFLAKGIGNMYSARKEAYNFEDYLHKYVDGEGVHFVNLDKTWVELMSQRIIISPELCIKDNKGGGKRPSSAYKDIYTSGMADWWWNSLFKTIRYIDTQKVEWKDENK